MRHCEICEKSYQKGNQISFSHKVTIKRFHPNLFKRRVKDKNNTKMISVCASCIKAGKI